MIGLLLVTHGDIGTALVVSAAQILGAGQAQIATLSVWRQDDPDDRELTARSQRWRPWRSYATQHLWTTLEHPVNHWPVKETA